MAITNRERKKRPTVPINNDNTEILAKKINVVETDMVDFDNLKEETAANRKTIKVDPDVKELIEIFSNFEGVKEYELIKDMAESYYKNNYDERAQRIIGINFHNKR